MKQIFFIVLLLCGLAVLESQAVSVEEVAKPALRPAGAPAYGDVCMSSRWKRPINADDPRDTLRDAAAFHATRIEWCYSFDADWIKQVKSKGYFYGGTLNSCLADQWPHSSDNLTYRLGRIRDRKGNFITAPWMSMWTPVPYWGCVNSPEYRKIYLDCARRLIEAGADAIQTDDPTLNLSALRWGGCFCEYCVSKAAVKYADLEDSEQLAAFAEKSVKEFFADMNASIKKIADRPIGTSSNNFGGRWAKPYNMFDYGMAEYDTPSPEKIFELAAVVKGIDKAQIITLRNESVGINRRTIALCYGTGISMLCPYDVYLRSTPDGSDRLFMPASRVADIYGFVRANAHYLNGYEDAAADGGDIAETRYAGAKPLEVMYKGMYGFVRAKPAAPDAPVVIHLLDWVGAKVPFTIKLNNANFFGGKPFDAKLITPSQYSEKLHEEAEQSKDYSTLSETADINLETTGDTTTASIPPINPWAMLILTPRAAD